VSVAEIELGLLLDCLIVLQRCIGLGKLGLQDIDLLLGGLFGCRVVVERRPRSCKPRNRPLCEFHAGSGAIGEGRIPIVLLLRIGEVGLIEINGVARLRNDSLLLVKARLEIVDIGLRAGNVRLGLIERSDVVLVVDGGDPSRVSGQASAILGRRLTRCLAKGRSERACRAKAE
jgi:hypothetical protein